MSLSTFLFYWFAAVTVVTAVLAVSRGNPVHSLAFFVPCLIHIGGLFLLLGAEFLAGIQVLVYIGAIIVLYLFVVALLNLSSLREHRITNRQRVLASAVFGLLAFELVSLVSLSAFRGPGAASPDFGGNTQAVGTSLYTTFLFPFELASLVLLAAVFGAVVLTRRLQKDGGTAQPGEGEMP